MNFDVKKNIIQKGVETRFVSFPRVSWCCVVVVVCLSCVFGER